MCYHYRNIFFLVKQKTLPTNYKSCKGVLDRKGKQTVSTSQTTIIKDLYTFEAARFLPRSFCLMMHTACFLPSPSVLKVPHIFITRSAGLDLP